MDALVRPPQPPNELAIEVGDALEAAAGQEAGLQIAVGPLDQALGLRVRWGAQAHAHAEGAPERLELAGQHLAGVPPLADAALLVPHRATRHRADLGEDLQHAGEHVMPDPARDHPGAGQAREPRDRHDDPQLVGLAEPHRDRHIRLPQVPLGQLTRTVVGALARVRWDEQRPQFGHPVAQDRDPPVPADALCDHRCRHLRELAQQPADLRFHRIDNRTVPGPLIARWLIRAQRVAHRVASDAQPTRDRLDPHPLSPMQTTDLGPVLHVNHPPHPLAGVQPGFEFHHNQWWTRPEGGQFSPGDRGSVFSRWRQARDHTRSSRGDEPPTRENTRTTGRPPEPNPAEGAADTAQAQQVCLGHRG